MGQAGMGQTGGAMLARGASPLAASLLFLLGVFHFFSGVAALARDNFYNVGANYPYQVGNDAWGWIHVIGGVLVAIGGLMLFGRRSGAARWLGIALAAVSLVINFFFLPYFPLWALLMIPLAIFAIWALVRDGSEERQREMEMSQRMAGAFAAPSGRAQQAGERREPVAATYGEAQTGQRWPENVGGREGQQGEGRWSPADVKEGATRAGERMQEQAAAKARGGQESGRNPVEEATERARQSANRDYRAGS